VCKDNIVAHCEQTVHALAGVRRQARGLAKKPPGNPVADVIHQQTM
jgi:hypothetical protein